jgi:ketosteroid isomerase-like protein
MPSRISLLIRRPFAAIGIAVVLLLLSFSGFTQSSAADEGAIRKVMADQAAAWNRGNLDDFMKGYWNNDSLIFIGKSGINYGYATALNNYKKNYDSPDKMGKLFFTLLKINRLSPDYCFVIGKWLLKRKVGDIGGIYTLVFRRIGGRWLIVSDHTS